MPTDFSQYDGASFALIICIGDESRVLRGPASFETHPHLGRVLRIAIADEEQQGAEYAFYLEESSTDLRIANDDQFGCDYSVQLQAAP